MDIYNIDIDMIPDEQLETYIGVYYIKQEQGKQLLYHTESSAIVLGLSSIKPVPIFDSVWKETAVKTVKKDSNLKPIFNKAISKTISLLDGVSNTCKYQIPWINSNDELITLTHQLKIIQKADDNTSLLAIGHVVNESVRHCKEVQYKTLKTENKLLKELNAQAIELNSLLAFSFDLSTFPDGDFFTANDAFKNTLGMKESKNGFISMIDFTTTQTMDLEGSNSMKKLLRHLDMLKNGELTEFTDVLVKQVHLKTKKVLYLKYNGRVTKHTNNNPCQIHGYVTNNTTEVSTKRQNDLLNKENKELQVSQRLAVKSGKVLIWYQNSEEASNEKLFYGNDILFAKLGIKKYSGNRFSLEEFNNTIMVKTQADKSLYNNYIHKNKDIIEEKSDGYSKLLIKHKNLKTEEEFYFEHNLIVEERFENGAVKTRGGYLTDVTKETEYRLEIEYLVQYDTVTNLHNRHFFEIYTTSLLPAKYTVIVIDIDGLKFINDAFGHLPGDNAISLLATIIKDEFDNDSKLFRIGGDEFVVITEDITKKNIDARLAHTHKEIAIRAKEQVLLFSASIGYEIVTNEKKEFDVAFTSAENIMYRNKLSKRKDRKTTALETILDILYTNTDETHEKYLRLSEYAINILQELGYNRQQEIDEIKTVCQLHDIGKITLPTSLFDEDNVFTKEDENLLQTHAEASYKIVKNLIDSDPISQSILHHHEQVDGQGYPMGLTADDIPMFSRVFFIVNKYDELTNQQQKNTKEALEYLNDNKDKLFDSKIVDAFINTIHV